MAYITSIQKVQVVIAGSNTTGTATITSVDTSKTFIVYAGYTTNVFSNFIAANYPYIELTNATTVTATRSSSAATTITVECTVIECGSDLITSIQRGLLTISDTNTSNTATISSVATGNTVVNYLGANSNNASTVEFDSDFGVLALDDSTTVSLTRGGSSDALTYSYEVVEFNSSAVESLQQEIITLTGTNTTDSHSITAVTMANTILFYGGCSGNTTNATDGLTHARLTSTTNIELERGATTSVTRYINVTALEFVSGVMTSVQRAVLNILTGTSNTSTISAVTTAQTAVAQTGIKNISGTVLSRVTNRLDLTNTTTVTATRGGSTTQDTGCSFEAWEFSTGGAGFANNVTGVANANIGNVMGVSKANISNVTGS